MTDLKPCPFCGGNDVALVDSEKLIGKFVVCNDCCVDGPMREKPADAGEARDVTAHGSHTTAPMTAANAIAHAPPDDDAEIPF